MLAWSSRWVRGVAILMSCFRTRTSACIVLLGTCFLLMLLLQMTSVAEEHRGSVKQCQELPSALLRRWSRGSVSLTPPEVDHVVSSLRVDLAPLREVEDLLLRYRDGSQESWNLLQEVRKHRVQLACTNHLFSTSRAQSTSTKDAPQALTPTEDEPRMSRPNETSVDETVFHRYLDVAHHIRKKSLGWAESKITDIASDVREIQEMRREADHESLASIVVNRKELLSNFLVDDRNQYIYCYIPKVACTQWKKIMMLTARTANKPFQNISHNEAHYDNKLPTLSSLLRYTDTDVLERLASYTKFMVVRSPMERLVSAYQDKFLSDNYDTASFKKNHARHMIQALRGEDVEDGEGLQFQEFLEFISSGNTRPRDFQEHWRPMYDLCHPCSIKYDFIAEFSTLEQDSNNILGHVLTRYGRRRVKFPPTVQSKTPRILEQYLDELEPSLLEAVKTTYLTDYEMFGY